MNDSSVEFMVDAVAFKRWGETVFEGRTPLKTALQFGIEEARDFYEAFITTGKLMAVKTVHRVETQETEFGFLERCSACEVVICPMDNFCPGCGARIIE